MCSPNDQDEPSLALTPTSPMQDAAEEISESYIEAMQRAVDAGKPANFRLTQIGEAGW